MNPSMSPARPLRHSLLASLLATLFTGLFAGCGTLSAAAPASGAAPVPTRGAAPVPASGVAPAQVAQADEPADQAAPPSARPAPAAESDGPLPLVDLTREILFQVIAAEVAVQRGQIGPAVTTYLALAQSTSDPRLARRATELALAERALDRALAAATLWYRLAPASPAAAQTIEALWLTADRFADVEPLLAARLAKARQDGSLAAAYQQLQRTLGRASDKRQALALLERLTQLDDKEPEAHLALAALAAAGDLPQRAAAEAQVAFNLRPDDERTAIATAQYTQATQLGAEGAQRILKTFLDRRPAAAEARYAYARLLAAEGRTEDARGQMELALRQDPESPSVLFALAQLAFQLKQPQVARSYLERYVGLPRSVPRDDTPAYLFLAQIAEDARQPADAIAWLEKITRGEQRLPAVMKRALLLAKIKKVDEARELLRNTNAPGARERAQLITTEAQVLREAGQFQEAFAVLDTALARSPGNPDLLYDHAMAAEKIDDVKAMEASLRKLIELRPEHAHAYNALGYTFAERNIRLDDAQTLIEKALTLSPDDPHIIDSMGWVLYRKGQLDRALEWLRKAYQVRQEPDVAAHLGEVLWKLGRTAEAREMWQSARKADPDNETLKETLARLNVAL